MKTKLVLTAACVLMAALSGCVTTRQVAPLPDLTVDIADAAMARIYVLRPATVGSAIPFDIYANDTQIGVLGPDSFLCWESAPGTIELLAKSENSNKLSLTTEASNVYYVHAHVRMGVVMARVKLELLDEDKGKEILAKCKPAKE